jgi:subtilisin
MVPATRPFRAAVLAILTVLAVTLALAPPVGASPRGEAVGPSATGRYIVVVDGDVAPSTVARDHGLSPAHVYRHALRGFAAGMSPRKAEALQRDGRVLHVEGETIERIQSQTLPTGIDRIETDRLRSNGAPVIGSGADVNLDVAIIDTGIAADHPDLNVVGGRNFTGGNLDNWGDNNGHGTHVAGTVGASDDGSGVVGVAPGARLWSLKVCPSNTCSSSAIVAAIDWMAGEKIAGNTDFVAANFSISSADTTSQCHPVTRRGVNATHTAICGAVDSGIVFVLAAGNNDRVKNAYPEAFSVSAVADFDGVAGGAGSPTCRSDTDDQLASFSNYGGNVDIAAPGVCILSTWNDGGYNTISGTSMATPHVTGAVALYIHRNANVHPATDASGVSAIEGTIRNAAHAPEDGCGYEGKSRNGQPVLGGPLLFVNATAFGGDGTCGVAGDVTDPDPDDPDPDPDDPVATTVTVDDIAYATQGRWHLRVRVSVRTTEGAAASGATVTINLVEDSGATRGPVSATTDSNGVASFQFNHALPSCYTTEIVSVNGQYTWDGDTPENGNC